MADTNLNLLTEGVRHIAEFMTAEPSSKAYDKALKAWKRYEATLLDTDNELPLPRLINRFRLVTFEMQCILLALAQHIEPKMSSLVQQTGGSLFSRTVTVRLAMECFCVDAEARLESRRSLLESGRLMRHGIMSLGPPEVGAPDGLMGRRLDLTTPTIRFLLQEYELSESVAKVARLEHSQVSLLNVILPPDHLKQARELVEHHSGYRQLISDWGFDRVLPYGRGITMLFSGPSGTGKTLLAQALAASMGRDLLTLSAADLPESEGLDAILRDLFTEASMRDAIVLVDECETLFGKQDKRKATAFRAVEDFQGILVLTTNHPEALDEALDRRIILSLPFELPDAQLRRQIWEVHLPPEVPLAEDIDLDAVANRYDFTGGTIKNAILVAVNQAIARAPKNEAPILTMELLEAGCRSQLRYALEELTVRTTTHLRLDDIILADEQHKKVGELIAACRNQSIVMNAWGFGQRLVTGKGIISLFDGPPGTGKTLCAEIIAGEMDRPIYRVNIPEVVSKWVGETEKHIRAIFQQARVSHAMLLFDEADSLFSARTADPNSSNDRYANMEVNLLLQEIERFPGICILTTNFWGSLDKALTRRIQFRVTFEEPDVAQRRKIWEVLCPAEAPLAEDVDFLALAKAYELTGGMIKNALLRAAYWAADGEGRLTMEILHDACRDEYQAAGKVTRDHSVIVEKPRTPADFATAPDEAPASPSRGANEDQDED